MVATIDTPSWSDTQQENAQPCQARHGTMVTASLVSMVPKLAIMPDQHPEWLRQADAIWNQINVSSMDEDASDALAEEMYALHNRIAQTPAQTREGVMAQLRVALEYVEASGCSTIDCERHALRNAIATLAGERT